jgi:hypothetical protein
MSDFVAFADKRFANQKFIDFSHANSSLEAEPCTASPVATRRTGYPCFQHPVFVGIG